MTTTHPTPEPVHTDRPAFTVYPLRFSDDAPAVIAVHGFASGAVLAVLFGVLLHATAYCGIPAGLDAFKAAHEVLVAEGALPGKK